MLRERLLTISEVEKLTGTKRSTIYKMMAAGTFPQQIKVTSHASRWRLSAVEAWLLSCELGDDSAAISQQVDLLLKRYRSVLTGDNPPAELVAIADIVAKRPPPKRGRGRPRATTAA